MASYVDIRIENHGPKEGEAFYILWNPSAPMPPRVRFATFKEARDAAEDMARRHAPDLFYVCKVGASAQVQPTPVAITRLKDSLVRTGRGRR